MVRRQEDGWENWGNWVLATIASGTVGSALGLAVAMTIGIAMATSMGINSAVLAISGAAGGTVLGAVVGIGQWLVLRQHFEKAGWWILVTALGMVMVMIGVAITTRVIAHPGIALIAVGAISGSVVAAGQWLILRQHFKRAGWWILSTALGGGTAMLIVGAMLETGGWSIVMTWAWVAGMTIGMAVESGLVYWAVTWAVAGAVVGALFGIVRHLQWRCLGLVATAPLILKDDTVPPCLR